MADTGGHTPQFDMSPAPMDQDDKSRGTMNPFGDELSHIPSAFDVPPLTNRIMYQSFEWYTSSWDAPVDIYPSRTVAPGISSPQDMGPTTTNLTPNRAQLPTHYSVIISLLPALAALGITSMWLPPGCKATSPRDNGYGIYDLYDLGEFECKGGQATKWGTKEELILLGKKAEEVGIGLLWDTILNHRAAADRKEKARAVIVNPRDRTFELGPTKDIVTWSVFDYPARQHKYSPMIYDWRHFSGIDWDDMARTKAIYKFVARPVTHPHVTKPGWAPDVATDELGNYDYLMFADVDYSQPDVRADVLYWSTWLSTQIPGLTGMRLDAIKHYSARFQYQLITHLRNHPATSSYFFVGEYWRADSAFLASHIDRFHGHLHLFDVQLVYNLSDFSQNRSNSHIRHTSSHRKNGDHRSHRGSDNDLRKILNGTLVSIRPQHAVTFVTNHDTQPTQSLAAPVEDWFIPHAYALILLRAAGFPCVFHGDVFDTYRGHQSASDQPGAAAAAVTGGTGLLVLRLCLVRKLYAYGPQHDAFDTRECIGWGREGHRFLPHHSGDDKAGDTKSQKHGLAVVVNTSWSWCTLRVFVGARHATEVWTDLMRSSWDTVVIGEGGWGVFHVGPRCVGVFTARDATGRDAIDGLLSWPPSPPFTL